MPNNDFRLYYLQDGRLVKTGTRKRINMFSRYKHYFDSVEQAEKHIDGMIHPEYFINMNITQFVLLEYFEAPGKYQNNTRIAKVFTVNWD